MSPRVAPHPWLLLLCMLLWLPAALPAAAEPPDDPVRLIFLRHGDLWSALPDGSDQRLVLALGGTIQRYVIAPGGSQVAVIRRLGMLDALEVHDLAAGSARLIRAAEGFIDQCAWSLEPPYRLAYTYEQDRQSPLRLFIVREGDEVQRYRLAEDERLLYFYPAPDGAVLVLKQPAGLRWVHGTAHGLQDVTGFPGRTITAMPLDSRRWLASLYAPGVGRSLQLFERTNSTGPLQQQATLDLPRSDLTWSPSSVQRSGQQEPIRVVFRCDAVDAQGKGQTYLGFWDLRRKQHHLEPLTGEVLVGLPVADPLTGHAVFSTQFQDGGGYGTAPAIWRLEWGGKERRLLVAEGQDPQWWRRQ